MLMVTLRKPEFKKIAAVCAGAVLCAAAALAVNAFTGGPAVEADAAPSVQVTDLSSLTAYLTGFGLEIDPNSVSVDNVKIPRKWDDSFSAFNGVVQQSGMDLTRYKGKTVEKWTALIPAASSGETSRYGVLLVYRKKAVGAYLLEKPSGTVMGLKDAQTAMAQAEQQDAQQVSGEDYSGDWGERHDEELGAAGQSQQTSGEPDSVVPEEAQYTDLPLDAEGYPVE